MDDIHERFNLVIKYLSKHGIAKSQKEVALAIGLDPNNFRAVLSRRVRLHTELLDKFLVQYPMINPLYLHGQSDEVEIQNDPIMIPFIHKGDMMRDTVNSTETIQLIKMLRATSISDKERYRVTDELENIIAKLQDRNSGLKSEIIALLNSMK